ncbi:MAG: DUF1579 domain-containing protein [Phycisphaeraceae bacterium]|nr:DUF1579 domain-containing protein [Phycisphaeraceae bacterium]
MHRTTLITIAATAVGLSAGLGLSTLAEPPKEAPAMPTAEDMAKYMEANSPGAPHQKLAFLVGEWDAQASFTMAPGMPPQVSKATSDCRWVLDGRFVHDVYKGMMGPMPFTGLGYTGYNNATEMYESVWMDSVGTGMMIMTGSYDDAASTLTLAGSLVDPMTREKKAYRAVTVKTGNDSHTFKMYEPGPDGKEFVSLQIDYTRRK